MRLLLSALSCNPALGSEALVGFKYAETLARRHEVVVLASPPSQTPDGATLVACNAGPCTINEVNAMALLRFELSQVRLARRLARRFEFDSVHRVTPSAIQVPTWAARLGKPLVIGPLLAAERPPSVFVPFLERPVSRPKELRWHPARVVARLCQMAVNRARRGHIHLRQAKRILVGTRTALRQVPEPWREKCRLVTYSGIEHQVYLPPAARLTNGALQLLFVGRLIPYKGVELLLRALAVAAKQCRLTLEIVGSADPVYKEYLSQLTRDLGLWAITDDGPRTHDDGPCTSTVKFLPPRPRNELPSLYQRADVFCFPTLCDTYGIALLEAMSCGCAVLVSDVAGAGEIVNGENGLKVPLCEPDQYIRDYAEKIITLARNRELRERLGATARQFILREHDWDRIGEQVLGVYAEFQNEHFGHQLLDA